MEARIIGEAIIKLVKQNKENLIEKLVENLKNEGKVHILKSIVEFLKLRNIQIKGHEPAKLYLAFDYDEKEIEKTIKEKFNINIKIIEKIINSDLILGGKIITSNYLIDFSFKNLLNKIIPTKNGRFRVFDRKIRKRIRKN
jgi:F0F1-type ATP synthase delta subunit